MNASPRGSAPPPRHHPRQGQGWGRADPPTLPESGQPRVRQADQWLHSGSHGPEWSLPPTVSTYLLVGDHRRRGVDWGRCRGDENGTLRPGKTRNEDSCHWVQELLPEKDWRGENIWNPGSQGRGLTSMEKSRLWGTLQPRASARSQGGCLCTEEAGKTLASRPGCPHTSSTVIYPL